MGLFSEQEVYCRSCGKKIKTDFRIWGGEVCGRNCFKELEWRKTLSILGKEYKPDPKAGTYEEEYVKGINKKEESRQDRSTCS